MSHAHLVKCNGQKQGGQDKDASGQKRLLIGGSRFLLGQIVGIGPELFGSRSGRTIGILFILCKIRVFPRARQLFVASALRVLQKWFDCFCKVRHLNPYKQVFQRNLFPHSVAGQPAAHLLI